VGAAGRPESEGLAKQTTIDGYRKRYARALYALSYDNASVEQVNAAARATAGENPTPERWVEAVETLRMPCRRCAGTGAFVTMVLNGRPTGPGGVCYRCEGKGEQDFMDGRRNRYHDRHYAGSKVL